MAAVAFGTALLGAVNTIQDSAYVAVPANTTAIWLKAEYSGDLVKANFRIMLKDSAGKVVPTDSVTPVNSTLTTGVTQVGYRHAALTKIELPGTGFAEAAVRLDSVPLGSGSISAWLGFS